MSSWQVSDQGFKSKFLFNSSEPYLLGSNQTLSVTYEVINLGETAYFPQILVSISNMTTFTQSLSQCSVIDEQLNCELAKSLSTNENVSNPIENNESRQGKWLLNKGNDKQMEEC